MSKPLVRAPSRTAADRTAAEVRLLSRLSVEFLLDLIGAVRLGRPVTDTLLMSVIVQSNVAEISRRADLQAAYADAKNAPPDELRRPVSIHGLATSLRLPFETVRRRVRNLASEGLCRFVEGGVIVPAAVLTSPAYLVNGAKAYERTRQFYLQLRDLGLLGDLPPATVNLAAGAFPLRAMARVTSDYVLRVIEGVVGVSGDLLESLILLEVFRTNVEHMPLDLRGGEALGQMVPDETRQAVGVAEVARRLGLPAETIRRHVQAMQGRGDLVRIKGGLVAPAEALARDGFQAAMVANVANLQRLFGALSQLGVLAVWDATA